MQRRKLVRTRPAALLLGLLGIGMAGQIGVGLFYLWRGLTSGVVYDWQFGAALLLSYPVVWAHIIVVPLVLGNLLVIKPRNYLAIRRSAKIFAGHPGQKIAVAGSYGKTTMKELLTTVLSEGKNVASTPANMNVAISHARFAESLRGTEEILVIEYGEGSPGDISRFAKVTHPTHGVVTGIAPAHLDRYGSVEAAAKDIFALAKYVTPEHFYVNAGSPLAEPWLTEEWQKYGEAGALGWRTKLIDLRPDGLSFVLQRGRQSIKVSSGLIGRHQVGSLSLVAALSFDLGLSASQVEAGLAKTVPVEHRMSAYSLGGAWIIDDTYNGNIEGVRAGTQLLKDLDAKRKIYATPGLVDQGEETVTVHHAMGELIANANPDLVVLMKILSLAIFKRGLNRSGFKGIVQIEPVPLEFYANLGSYVAAGDLVVLQNDWTDNYA